MGVKVLEVLRKGEAYCYDAGASEAARNMKEARAAVAELIEAADKLQHVYRLMDTDPDFVRLRTALARCNGGAA